MRSLLQNLACQLEKLLALGPVLEHLLLALIDDADALALTFAYPVAQQVAAPPSVFPGWDVIDSLAGY